MGTEIEAKFIVPDPASAREIRLLSRLGTYTLREGHSVSIRDDYLDTESRALLAAGYACRHREEDGRRERTLKSVNRASGPGVEVHRREEVEATPERLQELSGGEPLILLFSLGQDRLLRDVVDGDRRVAVASLDRVSLVMGSGSRRWTELEIELAPGGTEADLAAMTAWVRDTLGLHPSGISKFERALQVVQDGDEKSPGPGGATTGSARTVSAVLDGPDGTLDLPAAASGLGYAARVRRQTEDEVEFFDTHDGAFMKKGYTLSWSRASRTWRLREDGRLRAEEPGPREAVPLEGPIGDVLGTVPAEHPGIPMLAASLVQTDYALTGLAVEPLRLRSRLWTVRSSLLSAPPRTLLRATVSGPAVPLAYFCGLLQDRLGFRPARETLLEKGLALLGLTAPGAAPPRDLRPAAGDTAAQACRKVLRGEAWRMRMNAPGAVRDLDVEFVHDLRVATRRARSACRVFSALLEPSARNALRDELRWIAGLLGAVRDLDVLSSRLAAQVALTRAPNEFAGLLQRQIGARRARALAELVPALESERFALLLSRIEATGDEARPPEGVGDLPAGVFARRRIDKALRKLAPWAERPAETLSDAELHGVRILFKRLRYTFEFFRPLLDTTAGSLIDSFVAYQDCLGLHQDAATAVRVLSGIVEELPSDVRSDELLLSMGALLQVQRDVQQSQRKVFARRWESAAQLLSSARRAGASVRTGPPGAEPGTPPRKPTRGSRAPW